MCHIISSRLTPNYSSALLKTIRKCWESITKIEKCINELNGKLSAVPVMQAQMNNQGKDIEILFSYDREVRAKLDELSIRQTTQTERLASRPKKCPGPEILQRLSEDKSKYESMKSKYESLSSQVTYMWAVQIVLVIAIVGAFVKMLAG